MCFVLVVVNGMHVLGCGVVGGWIDLVVFIYVVKF